MRYSKGVLCPVFNEGILWEKCKECGEKYKFKCFPPPLLEYLYSLIEDTDLGNYTITELLDCPRRLSIIKESGYFVNPDNVFLAWKGIISHQIMEKWTKPTPGSETLIERRFKIEYPFEKEKITITFQPDRIDKIDNNLTIYDFKFVQELPTFKKAYRHHILQINLYAYFLKKLGFNINDLYIIYMTYKSMDVYKIDFYGENKTKEIVEEKLYLHKKSVPVLFDNNENWRCKYCEVLPVCYYTLIDEGYRIELKIKGGHNGQDKRNN